MKKNHAKWFIKQMNKRNNEIAEQIKSTSVIKKKKELAKLLYFGDKVEKIK